jgi:voltage-gated potassium channel
MMAPRRTKSSLWTRFNTPPPRDAQVLWLILFKLRWALLVILGLSAFATVAYVVLESYGWIDALYMTVITLGTVGYGEIQPLDATGRIVTIGIIIVGFTTFVYAVSVLTNLFVSGDVLDQLHQRRAKNMREELADHVIVVGFGRVGRAVAAGLHEMGQRFVVIDKNKGVEDQIRALGGIEYIGDATSPEDLRDAGIDRATALIAACDQDSENLVVVLTAHSTRADLRIVSRVNFEDWTQRMVQAGAAVAQSPYPSYGLSLAAAALSPAVLDLHDLPLLGLGTEEIEVQESSALIGATVAEVVERHPFTYVVSLRREDQLHPWYGVTGPIEAGDVLVAIGSPEHLAGLASTSESRSSDTLPATTGR